MANQDGLLNALRLVQSIQNDFGVGTKNAANQQVDPRQAVTTGPGNGSAYVQPANANAANVTAWKNERSYRLGHDYSGDNGSKQNNIFNFISKFFGGLAGDEETNSGIAINRGTPGLQHENTMEKSSKDGTNVVPFVYLDKDDKNAEDTKKAKYSIGYLNLPPNASGDLNKALSRQDNSEAVELYGITLANGKNLNYDESKKFLNSHNRNTLKLVDLSGSPYYSRMTKGNKGFMDNLHKYMSRQYRPLDNGTETYERKNIPNINASGYIPGANL